MSTSTTLSMPRPSTTLSHSWGQIGFLTCLPRPMLAVFRRRSILKPCASAFNLFWTWPASDKPGRPSPTAVDELLLARLLAPLYHRSVRALRDPLGIVSDLAEKQSCLMRPSGLSAEGRAAAQKIEEELPDQKIRRNKKWLVSFAFFASSMASRVSGERSAAFR